MKRKDALSIALASGLTVAAGAKARALPAAPQSAAPIPVPKDGKIKVFFVVSDYANVIDLAGPWETFSDMMLPDGSMPFALYTIAESLAPVQMTAGLRVEPHFPFDALPFVPNVLVVGAQSSHSDDLMELLRAAQGKVDLTMSVCTGAFKLAKAGILDGKSATTHHDFYDDLAKEYPKVNVVRGERFVDDGAILTAGGLSSGIDAALHVIARYFGPDAVKRTARYMEFVSTPRPA